MSVAKEIFSGAGEGLLKGLGSAAKGIREAISGKEIITGQERLAILEKVSLLENNLISAESSMAIAQIELNKIDAASSDSFRGNWRPAIGWVCVLGLFYQLIFQPLFPWSLDTVLLLTNSKMVSLPAMPKLDDTTLFSLISGLLGIGGFRTFEKVRGLK